MKTVVANITCSDLITGRVRFEKNYKRRERFCRYAGGDWTFTHSLWTEKKILMKSTLGWWSGILNEMSGALIVFSLAVKWDAFDSLIVCKSSALQLGHWFPEQRVWNGNLWLALVVSWRPCRQASPQKHAWGSRLFAKRPMMRNLIKNKLNIFTFLNRYISLF